MEPFTSNFLTGMLSSLTANIIQSLSKQMRNSIKGTDKEHALRRCIETGVVAIVSAASAEVKDEARQQLLADILTEFFKNPQAAMEIQWLLRGRPLDKDRLNALFEDAGYDASTLEIDFDSVITSFQAGFLIAAHDEPTLQGIIQTSQLLGQIHIQREILAYIHELIDFMRIALSETLAIQDGRIVGKRIGTDQQIVFQLPYIRVDEQEMRWESHYLRELVKRCDDLDLSPIDRTYAGECKPGEPCPVKISDVFTTLYLKGLSRFKDQDIGAVILKQEDEFRHTKRGDEDKQMKIQAIEAVAAVSRLVILGQPGSGKSTLVNYMASHLAKQNLSGTDAVKTMSGWPAHDSPLPVHIILRYFAAAVDVNERPEAGLVWSYLERQLTEWGCEEAYKTIRTKLIEEGGIIFFDGLDEVSEQDEASKRTVIIEAIRRFALSLDKCRIVITCREYAYKPGDAWYLTKSEFPSVELALFEDEQIKYFTSTWYKLVGPQKEWTQEKCEQEASNLYQAVTEWEHLYELAQYPLLLTLMAQVHGRDGYLPEDRADLYERAVELLLAHWENRIVRDERGSSKVEPGLVMRLGIRTKTLLEALERIAFSAHERQEKEAGRSSRSADIPKEDLREELTKELKSLDKAEEVISYIQKRAGLLQARDNRTYAFPHRTFQEYLTAAYCLLQGNFVEIICNRVKRDFLWWREVYLLAAGSIRKTPGNIVSLVYNLVPFSPEYRKPDSATAQHVLLVSQALVETDFTSHVRKEQSDNNPGPFTETYQRIQKWLNKLMVSDTVLSPKIRGQAGVWLLKLGDPRDEVMTIDAMEFCLVPAGPFWMGEGDSLHLNESLNYDYWASRYPVTNAQYREFVEAGGYKDARYWKEAIKEGFWKDGKVEFWQDGEQREEPYDYGIPFTLLNHPVVGVTWYEALAFTRWLTERWLNEGILPKGWSIVLPSEAEWEKAARGGVEVVENPIKIRLDKLGDKVKASLKPNPLPKRKYPWGDEGSENLTNCKESGINSTSAAGCFPGGVSPYGCEEKAGSVWEWTRSLYKFEYPYKPDDGRENLEAGPSELRTLRGGTYWNDLPGVGCGVRYRYDPFDWVDLEGFSLFFVPPTLNSVNSDLCYSEQERYG